MPEKEVYEDDGMPEKEVHDANDANDEYVADPHDKGCRKAMVCPGKFSTALRMSPRRTRMTSRDGKATARVKATTPRMSTSSFTVTASMMKVTTDMTTEIAMAINIVGEAVTKDATHIKSPRPVSGAGYLEVARARVPGGLTQISSASSLVAEKAISLVNRQILRRTNQPFCH